MSLSTTAVTDLKSKIKMYKLLKHRFSHDQGTIVYDYLGHDYGLCRDDEHGTGVKHIAVTEDPAGGTPFFTVPVAHLMKLEQ